MFNVYIHNGSGGKTKIKTFKKKSSAEKYSSNYHVINNDITRTIGKHVDNWNESLVGDTFVEEIL
jgi:hypothetical protein